MSECWYDSPGSMLSWQLRPGGRADFVLSMCALCCLIFAIAGTHRHRWRLLPIAWSYPTHFLPRRAMLSLREHVIAHRLSIKVLLPAILRVANTMCVFFMPLLHARS